MERIGVRELRQHASRYLAKVTASGDPIEITEHGRPIARLVPITDDPWADMVAAGEITPAAGGGSVRDMEPIASDFDASGELADLRAAER
ncbi:type II toxin-antitoxin system Phd/YefM family antitoxin [Mycobacterium scrofulaceum]|uniref:Antitoxin n=1 Tax=Mycobacterium scrofulaceum TaxID=1783 RepID=A0A1X0K258_MYCSC|nr:type II toxin-antitoxin system prevent-host-death family antitoxin [Mycobacterium scrofulaceum]ORB69152.1 prevent-host-death family antitoxin [Mycobacterium scrofulaceum]